VMRAFSRIKKRRCLIDSLREKLDNPRVGVKTRAEIEDQITKARAAITKDLATQPIRPALIDDVVAELRHVDQEFRNLEHMARHARPERCKELEARVGVSRAEFKKRYTRAESAEDIVRET